MQPSEATENSITRLRSFCDVGFDGNIEAAALVLGRDAADLNDLLGGKVPIDEDLKIKVNAIAEERGISLEGD